MKKVPGLWTGLGVRLPVLFVRFSSWTPSGHVSRVAPPPLRSRSIGRLMVSFSEVPMLRGSDSLVDKAPGSYPGLRGSNPHPARSVFILDPAQSRVLSWLLLLCGQGPLRDGSLGLMKRRESVAAIALWIRRQDRILGCGVRIPILPGQFSSLTPLGHVPPRLRPLYFVQ